MRTRSIAPQDAPSVAGRSGPGHPWRLGLLAVLLLVAAACGSDEATGAPGEATPEGPDLTEVEFVDETGAGEVEVDAVDNSFRPEYIEVDAGTTVTFLNEGRNDHNVLPVTEGEFAEVPVDDFEPGDEASITFDEPGDFAYYCSLHGTKTKGMVGAVRVVG